MGHSLRVGVVPKFNSHEAIQLASNILRYAEVRGIEAYIDRRASTLLEWGRPFTLGQDYMDAVIVVGGDGTVLNALQRIGDLETPIATIRYGKRGFLCDVPPFEYKSLIDRLAEGRYVIHKYMRLVADAGGERLPYVLNEYAIVTNGEARAKVARIKIRVDGEEVFSLIGDGVIIAPPVGSTAYSLAAGGPVVDPLMRAIIVTPLAPSTLCSRPVVFPPNAEVRVAVRSDSQEVVIIADGQLMRPLKPGDEVAIRKAPTPAYFMRFYWGDYYVRLFSRCM